MHIFPRLTARLLARHRADDTAPMGSPDDTAIRALAVSAPVLSLIDPTLAAFSPDQAHELGYALGRRG
ncbi:hypothetical protein [Acidisphaera rubrifaciens]|uniref:Uncharacterized protein n=1 Tax=Acidisphaera rubrifaciens HS-AP3 TaxID=1231350 RepID=A0A0D6P344_9PROT|nr:hypothetical protein [Acidisphaera rubrifaciens]GAN76170.1 hypothetical protein Asru_0067_08 [Acidisphaera rubrifaciens HS-AP3]